MLAWAVHLMGLFTALGGLSENTRNKSCTCDANRKSDGWCTLCNRGHLVGVEIKSARLFEALDAHGHDVQVERFICDSCKKAHAADGYCDTCRIGFVKGKAYLSRLTYEVARGRRVNVEELPCETCARLSKGHGWCEECGCGFIGNVAVANRAAYAAAEAAFRQLLAAVKLLDKCETCAVARFTGGSCRVCRLSYKTGEPVPLPGRP